MTSSQQARLGGVVADVPAQVLVAAIEQWWLRATAIDGGGLPRVSASRTNRGRVRSRERGEVRREERSSSWGPYPLAGRARGRRTARGSEVRPRGSLQLEVGDDPDAFAPSPLPFCFSFLSGPVLFLFFCFITKTCSNLII